MKFRVLTLCVVALLLAACGSDEPASNAAAPSAPAQAAAPAAAAPEAAPADEAPAMEDEEEFTYDPIDVSELENQWWQQYSSDS